MTKKLNGSNVRLETRPDRLAAMLAWVAELDRQDAQIAEARVLAGELYEPQHIDLFLKSRNELLDNRSPLSLIRQGEGDKVIEFLQSLRNGVYL